MKKTLFILSLIIISTSVVFGANAIVKELKGNVIKTNNSGVQSTLQTGSEISEGEKIITGISAYAVLILPDDSKIKVAEKTEFVLDEAKEDAGSVKMSIGKLRAIISKNTKRKKFEIITPASVCSVRGTDFEVTVDENKKTIVHVFEGLVAARQINGEEILIHQNERLKIEENMIPQFLEQTRLFNSMEKMRSEIATEVGLDMSREQVQTAAAIEMRNAEYQEGKTVIDVFGKRVRIDEYVLRPQSNQFKMVVLNDRDDRFDYFTYKATFDKDLPTKLSDATEQMWESKGTDVPNWKLTDYEKTRSNTVDSVVDLGSGGHYVFNNNKYILYFNRYDYKINNNLILYYIRNNDSAQNNVTYNTGFKLDNTKPDGSDINHDRLRLELNDGSVWSQEDYYVFDDDGKITSTSEYNSKTATANDLLKWNYQTIFTSSLFNGRKIDLVIEPKIMINTGIYQ